LTFGLLTEGQPAVVTSLSLGQAKSALFLSQKTVRNYVSGILDKLRR
jgi:DNA-binding NarL/FixJ family response regulator